MLHCVKMADLILSSPVRPTLNSQGEIYKR